MDTPVIFFSGLDRTGKSTTRKAFAESTQQQYITFDRSFIDNLVYDDMFRKKVLQSHRLASVFERFKKLGSIYIVHLVLNFEEINKRAKVTENLEHPMDELIACAKLFEKYLGYAQDYGLNVIQVDCDSKTVQQIVEEIKQQIGGVNG